MEIIKRKFVEVLEKRVMEWSPFIQVVLGPRQVGKTTGILQLVQAKGDKAFYATADEVLLPDEKWLLNVWQKAKERISSLLVIDEIQKISQWSSLVKRLWDKEVLSANLNVNDNNNNDNTELTKNSRLSLILLGSSSLDLHMGLTESLAGRFELTEVYHWDFLESQKAVSKIELDDYLKWGGYPGSYLFLDDPKRIYAYINQSILDTVINKDILAYRHVKKPSLFRQMIEILASYPACEISYNKLLGQLQEKGNVDIVKYYLELLQAAFLYKCLFKYSTKKLTTKSSSPKIIPLCPALTTVNAHTENDVEKGRVFEAVVGSDLLKLSSNVYYWREKNVEVDYIFVYEKMVYAIEVKSGRKKSTTGLVAFKNLFPKSKTIIIDTKNYSQFLKDIPLFLARYAS